MSIHDNIKLALDFYDEKQQVAEEALAGAREEARACSAGLLAALEDDAAADSDGIDTEFDLRRVEVAHERLGRLQGRAAAIAEITADLAAVLVRFDDRFLVGGRRSGRSGRVASATRASRPPPRAPAPSSPLGAAPAGVRKPRPDAPGSSKGFRAIQINPRRVPSHLQ